MTRLFSIIVFPSGYSQLVCGRAKLAIGEKFTDARVADDRCNELNEMAEEWRVLRTKEDREKRK